jgi:hypothetical protein
MPPKYANPLRKPPLDDQLYTLPPDALDYFKSQTGIQDENALKEHIITVQRSAYEVSHQIVAHRPAVLLSRLE